jgi:hypothetical protein
MDIVAYPPARPITAEIAADRATNFGYNPLELCFETPANPHWTYWYSPGQTEPESMVFKKPFPRSVLGLPDAIRSFLRDRGLTLSEPGSLWAWAVRHRWPWPDFLCGRRELLLT